MTADTLTPVSRTCENCGKSFPVSVKSPRQRFCSLNCSAGRPRRRIPECARFWAKVNKEGPVPACRPELGHCWEWSAYRNDAGYGQFTLTDGSLILAYHWPWIQEHGPISDGLELDHLCRNPACVRPDHLEDVTPSVNRQRGLKGDLRPPNELREKCRNGHLMTPDNRFLRKDRKREQYACRRCAADRQARSAARRGRAA